jgi:glycosyltransferase involved in cell wall biosynthesis
MKDAVSPPTLNLFYEEDVDDRWLPFVSRALRRAKRSSGGLQTFRILCAGLDRLGIPYRVNNYAHLRRHPGEIACVIGQAPVLKKIPCGTPIVFGSAGYGHPIDNPTLLSDHNIRGVLVPCEWVRTMCEPYWGTKVHAWAEGFDTDSWMPQSVIAKDIDVVVCDRIRCHPERDRRSVRDPIVRDLQVRGLRVAAIENTAGQDEEFRALLARSRSMVLLSEHETRGLALRQALSCDVPVFAWDAGGLWQDTRYHPHRVQFGPVTSTPDWDERCGMKFGDASEFSTVLPLFWAGVLQHRFAPRAYVMEHLTLEAGARRYADLVHRLNFGTLGREEQEVWRRAA